MRISELSRRSGVSVPTIKYYIREELLPAGRLTSPNQADYDEQHLRRLRLIRALIGVRGLSVDATRQVLGALAEQQASPHLVLGLALGVIPPAEGEGTAAEAPTEQDGAVDALVRELGWQVYEGSPARAELARTMAGLREFGVALDWTGLLPYARLAEQTARLDLDALEGAPDPLEMAERAVVLTTLLEPALMALRRLAQEDESARRHGG
ncbi:MerR family transcriptional regulator [Streptacidiphilus jiangxiensis]|uniref:MerR HTH family regulatory protein n=1 Tax=Streptacidiphilus jiangxiensis TaxID=235985 RepID=A0A1H7Z3B3_STRJI|nr:MerR family transcriptional regulator [Streptacidiphilus jiangxiensis]SEM52671.1 MerR HTH family regulatory protein [Streptacidiphilus jiangxiensis]